MLKGIHKVKKRLANGTERIYFYAWRGGPLLKSVEGHPLQPHEPEFHAAYAEACKTQAKAPNGTFSFIIKEYSRSSDFLSRAEKTKKAYIRFMTEIEDIFGDLTLEYIQTPRARGKFKQWRDTMADRPRTADYAWTTLARLLSFAKDRGMISTNVCERGGRLYKADRAEKIWTANDIERLMAVCSKDIQMALIMALWTGQRQGDMLALKWSAFDGKTLRIKQSKTGARVAIPVGQPLKELLTKPRHHDETILTNSRGQGWTEDGFRTSWARACKKAGINDLTFHDLRGTAVTHLALAGCTTSQIGAITGHSLKDVHNILDMHYLGGQQELALIAIQKLEAQSKIVPLQSLKSKK